MFGSRTQADSALRPVLAGLLAALLLVLSLLAARESVSHALEAHSHHDSGSCFLCLLTHGKLDQPAPSQAQIPWNPALWDSPAGASPPHIAAATAELPPGRGPPGLLSSSPQAGN